MANSLSRTSCAALLVLAACGQDYNSNSGDEIFKKQPTETFDTPEASRRGAAVAILRTRCFSCHIDMAAYKTDAAWVASGRVKAGNSDGSVLITKLINAGGDMPQGGSALPQTEYEALKAWVDQMPSGG